MKLIQIHWIEEYNYCKKQIENELQKRSVDDLTLIDDGTDVHNIKIEELKKELEKYKERKKKIPLLPNKELLSSFINQGKNCQFREIYVESIVLGIIGKIDEVCIKDGELKLIENKLYHSRFKRIKCEYENNIKQLIAYALAFKDYYNYNSIIELEINRLQKVIYAGNLELNEYRSYYEPSFTGDSKLPYTAFYTKKPLKDLIQEIKEDIEQIRLFLEGKIRFKGEGHKVKCERCIYRKSCEESLYKKGSP